MPLITIKLADPMPSKEKLDSIAAKITDLMVNDLGKSKERVIINFQEIRSDSTYFGAQSIQSIKESKNGSK